MKVKLYFQPSPDSQETAHIYFTYLIKVQSPLPLEGNVWIARKGSKIERESGLKIILPPIGEEFHISYDAIEVRTSLNQVIDNLAPFLPPFRHVEKGVELESINRNWANVSPSVIRGLTASRYVPLKVSVEIPSEIPPDIPDGAYQSVLEIRDGVRVIDSVPVSIGVSIPRLVFNKEDINKPFDPNVEVSEKIAEKTILYPGDIPHSISVKLWSTSLSEVEAKGYFMDKRALKYTIEGEAEERTDHVLYDVAGVTFNIPGKNERTPGSVKSEVRLKDPSLNGMTFMNTIYITGKQHREIPVKLIVKVYFIPPIFLRSGFMLLFALGIYLISRWWGLRKFRDLFEGAETVKEISEGEESDHEIRFKRRVIGKFSYNGGSIPSASVGSFIPFEAKNRVILFEAENASYRRDETREDITQSYFPQEGDEIIVGRGKGRFTIRINKLPSADEPSYSYSIEQSPLGSGKMMYFHFVSAMLFSFMSLLGFIYPYLILQLIRL